MTAFSLRHLSNPALLHGLASLVTRDCATTAAMLAHLAEVDERKLYRPAAYDSMFLYCVHELHMSEDVAYKRITAARAARRFPGILPMVADGRLNLTAALLLAPHLTAESVDELLTAASYKTKPALELLLARRFPQPDVPTLLQAVARECTPVALTARPPELPGSQLAPERVVASIEPNSVGKMEPLPPRPKLAPLAPDRFALQVTISGSAHDLLRQAQALLGHAVPSGDVAQVIERALEALVQKLEKQRFAKCARPRPQRGPANGRHIPAAVKRAVHERDGGQCTFVSEHGKRCESRTRLEYDHVEPFARGGQATVSGVRLRCRPHNQYGAECTFGSRFMAGKREGARDCAAHP
jgi:hypothetical protein